MMQIFHTRISLSDWAFSKELVGHWDNTGGYIIGDSIGSRMMMIPITAPIMFPVLFMTLITMCCHRNPPYTIRQKYHRNHRESCTDVSAIVGTSRGVWHSDLTMGGGVKTIESAWTRVGLKIHYRGYKEKMKTMKRENFIKRKKLKVEINACCRGRHLLWICTDLISQKWWWRKSSW
jgi:hypothetical protein